MKLTNEELRAEVERLRAKLSPLEDRDLTIKVKAAMRVNPLKAEPYIPRGSHKPILLYRPADLWQELFNEEGNTRDYMRLGRSLQAMGWERSAKSGNLVFALPVEELESAIQ